MGGVHGVSSVREAALEFNTFSLFTAADSVVLPVQELPKCLFLLIVF